MNTFACAPKDGPKLRETWRTPYDDEELARLKVIERCRSAGMELTWCISPGLSMRYSDIDDVTALTTKIRSVLALGATHIGLLLDDIPPRLQHPQDQAAFSGLEQAHVGLANTVLASLPPEVGLILCPSKDWGMGTEESLAQLGAGLDPRIDLFWTGRTVCAATLDLADAETFTRTAKRPPTYWDNYPVNDLSMVYELHIGPYRGRYRFWWQSSHPRTIANGMELFEASKICSQPSRTTCVSGG